MVDKIPDELYQNFKDNLGVFFVGAGLSIPAGLPTWDQLLDELIAEAAKQPWFSPNKKDDYAVLRKEGKFLFLAEEIKNDLGGMYSDYMEKRFVATVYEPTINHEYIAKTQSSLIITINYDRLIERAYNKIYGDYPEPYLYSDSRAAANLFWKSRFFVLKAHGDAKKDIESIVLSQKDYRRTLYREPGYRSLLQAIFTTKSILFVGVSMTDPEFNQLLDYLNDSYHGGGPRHYLLIESGKCVPTMSRRFYDDFNIETITYENADGKHGKITEFLKGLSEAAPCHNIKF
ncbi:SIR2 family protein [Mucilaginibacter glaciei]|uniref:SIR2 family protein n=1 Tax=Mucilaginibacter glaciei TaxID=2772109 RepID=A0A926NVC2_9SPHI|nr:SIR2 family protein [Mucilaginibacter glaciei]MBD1395242.1 SIR2 family protein [Mucilaginibacter glaciei]